MAKLKHPLAKVVRDLRQVIVSTHREIGEEIKWNAPTFFYSGKMKPTDPKEYRRYIVVFNLYKQDCIRLVFPSGAKVKDASGYWKATMRMEESWRCSTARRMSNPRRKPHAP